MPQDSFGLTFGINRFISVGIQTLITFVVTDKNCLGLDGTYQFKVYGAYYLCLAVFFGAILIVSSLKAKLSRIRELIV